MPSLKDPTLQHVFDRLCALHEAEGRLLTGVPVQYGVQLTLSYDVLTAAGTLYHSPKKRRLSFVPNRNGDPAMAQLLRDSVNAFVTGGGATRDGKPVGAGSEENGLERWMGTDEAGKGDLFGPLVVGGFYANKEIAKALHEMGVRDSKELASGTIHRLARDIRDRYHDRLTVVVISPDKYNQMYPDFQRLGGINGLLGWAHARAIKNLVEAGHDIQAAVVDRFGGEHRLTRNLPRKGMPKLIVRPKAESNMAVAAGAILARARYEDTLAAMEKELGFKPHAGSGSPAVKDLKHLAAEKRDDMYKYVKMHFSPVKALGIL